MKKYLFLFSLFFLEISLYASSDLKSTVNARACDEIFEKICAEIDLNAEKFDESEFDCASIEGVTAFETIEEIYECKQFDTPVTEGYFEADFYDLSEYQHSVEISEFNYSEIVDSNPQGSHKKRKIESESPEENEEFKPSLAGDSNDSELKIELKPKKSSSKKKKSKKSLKSLRTVQCPHCNHPPFMKHSSGLRAHINSVHLDIKPKCEICDVVFAFPSGMKKHLLSLKHKQKLAEID